MISRILLGASAAIILVVGGVHLAHTAFTHKFPPTEEQLETAMKRTHSLLIMARATQKNFRHEVPKEPDITEPCINLTFRRIEHR